MWIAALLVNETFAYGLILALVAITVVSAVKLQRQMATVVDGIREAAHIVKPDGGKSEFAREFDEISERIGKIPFLQHAWNEFNETLVPRHLWKTDEVANTDQPGRHFQLDELLDSARVHRRFYGALPNFLVGTGLLFTFAALGAGVTRASDALDANSVDGMTTAFKGLLGGAFLSFAKSAVGIGCSIAFGFWEGNPSRTKRRRPVHCAHVVRPVLAPETLTESVPEIWPLAGEAPTLSKGPERARRAC